MDCYWDFLSFGYFWLFVLLRFDVDHLDFDIKIGKLWEQQMHWCKGTPFLGSWWLEIQEEPPLDSN